jgi:molybdate transport system substrate-binding protein
MPAPAVPYKPNLEDMMFRKITTALVSLGLLATAFAAGSAPVAAAPAEAKITLTVFAAASLTEAFTDISNQFELYNKEADVDVVLNFSGSQVLSQQIKQGASFDVFASANQAQMDVAATSNRVSPSTVFVLNRLVVIYPTANPGGVKELKDLAKPGLKLVLAAKAVPVGQYSLDFLTKASADPTYGATFINDVLKNVVSYEDNVRQVLAKVALGEADAGIVYTTDVLGSDSSKVVKIKIPDNLNTIARYPIAYATDAKNAYWARAFYRFVLSRDGQRTLSKYGFIMAAPIRPATTP